MCSMLAPGEGMLVGSFARAGFLVHSECTESRYINSRPFRVNAGPVYMLSSSCTAADFELTRLREALCLGQGLVTFSACINLCIYMLQEEHCCLTSMAACCCFSCCCCCGCDILGVCKLETLLETGLRQPVLSQQATSLTAEFLRSHKPESGVVSHHHCKH